MRRHETIDRALTRVGLRTNRQRRQHRARDPELPEIDLAAVDAVLLSVAVERPVARLAARVRGGHLDGIVVREDRRLHRAVGALSRRLGSRIEELSTHRETGVHLTGHDAGRGPDTTSRAGAIVDATGCATRGRSTDGRRDGRRHARRRDESTGGLVGSRRRRSGRLSHGARRRRHSHVGDVLLRRRGRGCRPLEYDVVVQHDVREHHGQHRVEGDRDEERARRATPLHAAPTGVMLLSSAPARCAASAMRAGDWMNEMRKNPSPPAPNDDPDITTTPCSSSSRSANVADAIPSGSLIHRYIVARGTSHSKPAARNDDTAASRRAWKIATFCGTNSAQLASAATPAAWIAMNCPVSTNDFTLSSVLAISGFATAQPQRQPVMLYVLLSEGNSIATSRAPSIWKMLGGT